jgi:hypothetical protein
MKYLHHGQLEKGVGHRVYRLQSVRLSVQLSELGPHPVTRKSCSSLLAQGGDTLACGEGVVGSNFDEVTDTLGLPPPPFSRRREGR